MMIPIIFEKVELDNTDSQRLKQAKKVRRINLILFAIVVFCTVITILPFFFVNIYATLCLWI